MDTFERLETWKKAQELRRSISQLAKTFPDEERNRLSDQIIRSSRQAATRIARGFGIGDAEEDVRLCRQARGALSETLDHLVCAYEEHYVDEHTYKMHRELIQNAWDALNGYIASLNKTIHQHSS